MLHSVVLQWIKSRLALDIELNSEYFIRATRDGTILAKILCSYHVIPIQDLQNLEETTNLRIAAENYKYIKTWLSIIGIELTESDVYELTHGNENTGLVLFYEIYQRFENKKIRFIPIKAEKRNFLVQAVQQDSINDVIFESSSLCEPLLKDWDVINWERSHLASLLIKYSESRKEYEEFLGRRQSQDISSANGDSHTNESYEVLSEKWKQYTYKELLRQQKVALALNQEHPSLAKAKSILKNIKKRNKVRAQRTQLRLQFQHELYNQLWAKILENEEKEFDAVVCQKLQKQSAHEKEISDKLQSIRQQKDTMIQNRKLQDERERKEKDALFIRRLFEESLEDRLNFHDARMAKIAEHKRLYAEKLHLKALKHHNMCEDIIKDVIDIALKTIEYKNMYGLEPHKYLKRNWATLFIKQQPILEPIESESITPKDIIDELNLEDIPQRNIKRLDVLDQQYFLDYIRFDNLWVVDESLLDFLQPMELGMNCLGFAVHRLLLQKYPLPVPQKPVLCPEIEMSVCTNNITDLTKLDYFERLLKQRGVAVILMETVINFCIKAFDEESRVEYDDPFPDENDLKQMSPSPKQEKGEKKRKGKGKKSKKGKDKKSQKSKGKKSKSSKGKKSKKEKKTKAGTKSEEVVKTFEQKQAQTPKVFPCEKLILSNKARLGKIAKNDTATNSSITDKIFVDMLIEYLQSLKDIKGWVLINFPNTYEQAALLEQALTGKPAPQDYYDNVLNQDSTLNINLSDEKLKEEHNETLDQSYETALWEEPEQEIYTPQEIFCDNEDTVTETTRFSIVQKASRMESVTLIDDWKITPEEKTVFLLPDLAKLAFSNSDYRFKSDTWSSLSKSKTCTCVCKTIKTKKKTMAELDFEESEENLWEEKVAISFEDLDEGEDCVCYLQDTNANTEKTFGDKITQTVIMGSNEIILDDSDRPIERYIAVDIHVETRISIIVPNPRPIEKEVFSTALTALIHLERRSENDEDSMYALPMYKEFERINGLEKFYCDQGCFYLLQYEEFNGDAVKCLAKMVIGDYSLPFKDSIELFGVNSKQAVFQDGDIVIMKRRKKKTKEKKKNKKKSNSGGSSKTKKGKKKSDKKSKSSKKLKKSKKSKGKKGKKEAPVKVDIEYADKEVQMPLTEEVEEEEVEEPRAGELNWEYTNFTIADDLALPIANLWENAEHTYIQNFKDIFFQKRVLVNDIVPFLAKITELIDAVIDRDEEKQRQLRDFQKILNQIDLEMREDPLVQSELLCRIEEFKSKLLDLCDAKMKRTEEERQKCINHNWIFKQFCEMTNNAAVAFQLETDRFMDTMQFICSYYLAVILKTNKRGYEYHKELLKKFAWNESLSAAFNTFFIEPEKELSRITPFHQYIDAIGMAALKFIQDRKPLLIKPLSDMRKLLESKAKKGKKTRKQIEPDEEVKEKKERIFEEWECAINGEIARMNIHLKLLVDETCTRFDDIMSWVKRIFTTMYEKIRERHQKDIQNVEKACKLLRQSVEQGVIIQPELIFDGAELETIEVVLFPDPIKPFNKDYADAKFTMPQLYYMVRVLLDLAANGFIIKKTFLLLIQDILYQDDVPLEPETLWRNVSTSTLQALFKKIFDDEHYIYWKDFIVSNLGVPFPTSEKLLAIRTQFRSYDKSITEKVTRSEFDTIPFWFDDEANLVKSLVFQLYQLEYQDFNYPAMLLDFCKDEDPVLGFVKALELSLGKRICWNVEQGKAFVRNTFEQRSLFEKQVQEYDETIILAQKAVTLLIDQILDEYEGPEGLQLKEIIDPVLITSEITETVSMDLNETVSNHNYAYNTVGFEPRDDLNIAYFLPVELVVLVVDSAIPWCSKVEEPGLDSFKDKIVKIHEECRNEDFNNMVLAHEFLNYDSFKQLLGTTTKFLSYNPIKLIKNVVSDDVNDMEEEEIQEIFSGHSFCVL